jgi:hypothetical protein
VSLISAPTPASVTLTMVGGLSVVWGDASNSARKAQALAALLKTVSSPPVVLDSRGHPLPTKKPTVLDVSDPNVVTSR